MMNKLSTGFLSGILLSVVLQANAAEKYHPHHLFIKMDPGHKLVKSQLIKSSKKIIPGLYLVQTQNADQLAQSLEGQKGIEYVQRDYYSPKETLPKLEPLNPALEKIKAFTNPNLNAFNDPHVGKLWAFGARTGLDVSGAYGALPGHAPEEVIVAVVDTGVDHTHEDLKDVMWVNTDEIAGDGVDNDANGYVDDIHGINTLVRDANGNATMNTQASHWHGTHVAGTIAATQNNGVGIAGVASNVKIMAIRTVPDDSDELDSDVAEAYKYAADNGAKVINCSFGKSKNEGGMVVRDVINHIGEEKDVLVVISAGNDSFGPWQWADNDRSPKYPASFDSANTLVIASTTNSGGLSSFSNIGRISVDIASPGSDIYSTVPGNRYNMASGTSMAAPNASGVVAMVRGYYPNLKVAHVKDIIMRSVVKVNDFTEKLASGGRINLKRALTAAASK